MKKIFILSLMIINCMLVVHSQTKEFEAENCILTGVSVQTNASGYSGTGFVSMAASGSITINIDAPAAAFYKLVMRVATTMGNKDQDLYLNEAKISTLKFPANASFFEYNAGNLALISGNNTIEIKASWGYMYFDKFTFTSAQAHDYSTTALAPINLNATQKAKDLYSYLRANYGQNIISGQTAYWDQLIALAGKTPVLRAFDMQNYSPHNPWHTDWSSYDDGTVQNAINWYNSTNGKGIVSFQWHWFSPSGGALSTSIFYTDKTTFDVSKIFDTNSQEYRDMIRDIDAIAIQLKRLQTANVPVLWRPLHEAGGAWFWWGAKGAAACLKLYDIMYDRLVNYHQINNLIWVWSTPEADWYPGNSKVDILGYDSYPGAYSYGSQKSIFDQLFDITQGQKMITMSENGPIPDIDKCFSEDAKWLYFSSWSDLVASQNTTPHIQAVYAHSKVITLDKVVLAIHDEKQADLQLFPNPFADQCYLNIPTNGIYTLTINDIQGRQVKRLDNIQGDKIQITSENLVSGLYFYALTNQKKVVTRGKFIINK